MFSSGSIRKVWVQILKRINEEINRRRKAGEKLPPPPKTAIAGPEYFGFNQAEVTYLPLLHCKEGYCHGPQLKAFIKKLFKKACSRKCIKKVKVSAVDALERCIARFTQVQEI